jgi:cytochrome c
MLHDAVLILVAAATLSACDSARDSPTESPIRADPSAPDVAQGEILSLACQACHTLNAGGPHLIGPNLHGVFGRRAGTEAEFQYSSALVAAEFVWTPEALDAWLADPAGYLPGTTMAFTGYQSPRDREDLIAYLVAATTIAE